MPGKLILAYSRDFRDDFAALAIRVDAMQFAGRGSHFVQWQDLADFGAELSHYPLRNPLPSFVLAVGDSPRDLRLRVAVVPIDSLGHLVVDVEFTNDLEASCRVQTRFSTHYPQVETFARDLVQMAHGKTSEAILIGA